MLSRSVQEKMYWTCLGYKNGDRCPFAMVRNGIERQVVNLCSRVYAGLPYNTGTLVCAATERKFCPCELNKLTPLNSFEAKQSENDSAGQNFEEPGI